ncbi:hypothetical protein JOE53_001753 [Microbacterium laevaniformans]|nr:hypothetical protein [Microbacterium laevaniformans]
MTSPVDAQNSGVVNRAASSRGPVRAPRGGERTAKS